MGVRRTTGRCRGRTTTSVSALLHEPSFKALLGDTVFKMAKEVDPARQPGGARRAAAESARLGGGGLAPVPVLLLVRPHLRPRREAAGRPDVRPAVVAEAADRRRRRRRRRSQELQRALEEERAGPPARRRRELRRPGRARGRAGAAAGRGRGGEGAGRGDAGRRTTTPRPRPATTSSTCCSREAGWPLDQARDREFEVTGMPTDGGQGLRRLRAVGRRRQAAGGGRGEAHAARRRASASSRRSSTPTAWRQMFGQRPVIFYSNGYEHWIWDDARYPPRAVQGFYTKDELELADPAAHDPRVAGRRRDRRDDRRALLPDARASAGSPSRSRRDNAAQGAGRDGDRRRQDPHGHRAVGPADAGQLGQARPVPRRPHRAGEPGGQRVQDAPARLVAGQPRDRAARARAGSTSRPTRR